jgi:hypothetical protein
MMALHFVIKTAIFESTALAIAGIVGYLVFIGGSEAKRLTQDEK